jgi:hypothetical protein
MWFCLILKLLASCENTDPPSKTDETTSYGDSLVQHNNEHVDVLAVYHSINRPADPTVDCPSA